MIAKFFGRQGQESEEHWVSISDVMAGLMVIFLFVAISYMLNVHHKTKQIIEHEKKIETLLDNYKNLKDRLAKALQIEFEGDSHNPKPSDANWQGYLNMDTLTIGFKQPFQVGGEIVPEGFKGVLMDFFPRYIAILSKTEYREEIEEIRIEGHTSSEWLDEVPVDVAFMNNMELSQNRARNVLDYVLEIDAPQILRNKIWLKKKVTANGLSSSHLILDLVEKDSLEPANPYSIISEETEIEEFIVMSLHKRLIREIPNWQKKQDIDKTDIIKSVSDFFKIKLKPEAIERVISLLLEDREASRRVEFRVVTKSEKLINNVKQLVEDFNKSRE